MGYYVVEFCRVLDFVFEFVVAFYDQGVCFEDSFGFDSDLLCNVLVFGGGMASSGERGGEKASNVDGF